MNLKTILVILMLMLPIGLADMNASLLLYSDGNINFWSNINSNGSTNVWIDGTSYPEYVNQRIGESHFSVWDMVNHLEDTTKCFLGEKKHCSEWNFRIFDALASVFVTRGEQYNVNDEFDIRLSMLERTMEVSNAENYCVGRISVMIERELDWVMCNETKYINVNGKGISVTGVNSE